MVEECFWPILMKSGDKQPKNSVANPFHLALFFAVAEWSRGVVVVVIVVLDAAKAMRLMSRRRRGSI